MTYRSQLKTGRLRTIFGLHVNHALRHTVAEGDSGLKEFSPSFHEVKRAGLLSQQGVPDKDGCPGIRFIEIDVAQNDGPNPRWIVSWINRRGVLEAFLSETYVYAWRHALTH